MDWSNPVMLQSSSIDPSWLDHWIMFRPLDDGPVTYPSSSDGFKWEMLHCFFFYLAHQIFSCHSRISLQRFLSSSGMMTLLLLLLLLLLWRPVRVCKILASYFLTSTGPGIFPSSVGQIFGSLQYFHDSVLPRLLFSLNRPHLFTLMLRWWRHLVVAATVAWLYFI